MRARISTAEPKRPNIQFTCYRCPVKGNIDSNHLHVPYTTVEVTAKVNNSRIGDLRAFVACSADALLTFRPSFSKRRESEGESGN